MKKSIALTLFILVLGVVPGLFQQKRLAHLREDHRELVAVAVKAGVSADPSAAASEQRITKRQRQDIGRKVEATTAEVIAFAREMEELEKSGVKPDDEFQRRGMEMMAGLMELDSAQMKRVIAALRESREISDDSRRNIIGFSIMMLANDHPEMAVAMFSESSDLLEQSTIGEHVISSSLRSWAEQDPHAALEWIRHNSEKFPEVANDEAKRNVIAGTAVNDPKLAFKLLGELKMEDAEGAVQAILMAGDGNPEQRSAVLAALREHLATIPDVEERTEIRDKAFESFARNSEEQGFDELTGWMSKSGFTQEEKEQFAGGLNYFTTQEDTGRWVEWISGNLPADRLGDSVRDLVSEWTQQDYQAAGKWLGGTPAGPAKTAAIGAYAEAVAEYEPQVAAQWAMTLPPGPSRESTLRAIHQNWPAGDPEGSAAFAREHGLNE